MKETVSSAENGAYRKRKNPVCAVCFSRASSLHHIIPRSQGGKDDEENLIWLCTVCHDKVHQGGYKKSVQLLLERKKRGF